MELDVFVRLHARAGEEPSVEAAVRNVIPPTRKEAGCVAIHGYRSIRDPQLFLIHSTWKDEAAFDLHGGLPHTVLFLQTVDALLDQPREIARAVKLA